MKNLKFQIVFDWRYLAVGLNIFDSAVYFHPFPFLCVRIWKEVPKRQDYVEISRSRFVDSTLVIPEISEEDMKRVVQNIMDHQKEFYRRENEKILNGEI